MGGWEGRREGGWVGGRVEGGRKGGREGGRVGGREGGREQKVKKFAVDLGNYFTRLYVDLFPQLACMLQSGSAPP